LIAAAAPLVKTRITRLEEAPPLVRSIFVGVEPDSGTVEKVLRQPYAAELLKKGYEALEGVKSWDAEGIGNALRAVQAEMGLGRKAYQVFYVAITGSTTAAPLFDLMEIIGKEKSLKRLQKARSL
jgi:glutamyl-tRNA synthetase